MTRYSWSTKHAFILLCEEMCQHDNQNKGVECQKCAGQACNLL